MSHPLSYYLAALERVGSRRLQSARLKRTDAARDHDRAREEARAAVRGDEKAPVVARRDLRDFVTEV